MFCRKCGNQIPDDSVFCLKCGTKVEAVNNDNQQDSKAEQEFVCPTCGGRVTIVNGWYTCHNNCGYKYQAEQESSIIPNNIDFTNKENEKTPILTRKQLYILAGCGVIGFVSIPTWYMNILFIAVILICWNFAKKAYFEKKKGKLAAIVAGGIVAFVVLAIPNQMLLDHARKTGTDVSLKSFFTDSKELQYPDRWDISKYKKYLFWVAPDGTPWYLITDKIKKESSGIYTGYIIFYFGREYPNISKMSFDINNNRIQMLERVEYTNNKRGKTIKGNGKWTYVGRKSVYDAAIKYIRNNNR